ncbi:flagellin-like hook-associated protein FlgL [Polynucleobacter sphagniphilus]|uniref:hypothetical protein n=1 Tax=Polynucleobacter sphagniphilus TaxID=1743169 RepID=UPI002473F1B5|nr:hypothetical protein [Polynucleobacter sphagniphilus]MDH6421587.1 flagellin-like hook-associated protein FlgL [Polynucleobacter sphagniphilus]
MPTPILLQNAPAPGVEPSITIPASKTPQPPIAPQALNISGAKAPTSSGTRDMAVTGPGVLVSPTYGNTNKAISIVQTGEGAHGNLDSKIQSARSAVLGAASPAAPPPSTITPMPPSPSSSPTEVGSSAMGGIEVTPQMMNKLGEVSQKITQKQQNLDQQYTKKVNEVKMGLDANGYEVTTVVPRSDSLKAHTGDYYVTGPQGGVVEVSTTTTDYGRVGNGAQKNITVYQPGDTYANGVAINIEHPDVKAAIFHKSDITPSVEVAEDALKVSDSRGNVNQTISSPGLAYPK